MKKALLSYLVIFQVIVVFAQDNNTTSTSFNPTIKFKGLIHARYEYSLTDSIDVQGRYAADPLQSNFRLRRAEIRTDIKLNDHWSGVIRV